MNYIVYKTTNKVNGKIYIGIHRTDLNRKQSYIGCGVSRRDQKKSKKSGFPAVAKYTDEGFFVESYSSIKEAAEDNDIKTPANIIAAIKGQQKRCGGFRWRYFYGNTSNIKPL